MNKTKIDKRIFLLFALVILCWGLAWPVNKMGLEYMSALWYTASRLITGTIAMSVIVFSLGKLSLPTPRELPLIAIIGLLQISIYMLLANIGLSFLPAGRSSLIAYTTPLWVMPIATFILKEEAGIFRWIGFFLGVLGLLILLSPWQMDWSNRDVLIGTAMLLLASLCWAISMFCVRYMRWTKSPLELIPWQLLLGTIPILALTIIKEPHPVILWSWPLIISLVYTGVLVTGISYWLGVIVNKELPTIMVSLGFLLVPVLSISVSAFFMHESIDFATASAMALILIGLMFVVW